jgi:hypothetical protein
MHPEPSRAPTDASSSCTAALEALLEGCRDAQARGVPPELVGGRIAPLVLDFALRAREARLPPPRALQALRDVLEPLALLPEEERALMRRAIDTYYQVSVSGILRGE